MIENDKPMLGFAAHLANWELPALVAKSLVPQSAVLYRRPNIRPISDLIVKLRDPLMGELVASGLDAPVKLARLLRVRHPCRHAGRPAFQQGRRRYFLWPALPRQSADCDDRAADGMSNSRTARVRKPDGNSFSVEITDPIEPVRDADGRIDIKGTMQTITSVIESWVRRTSRAVALAASQMAINETHIATYWIAFITASFLCFLQ